MRAMNLMPFVTALILIPIMVSAQVAQPVAQPVAQTVAQPVTQSVEATSSVAVPVNPVARPTNTALTGRQQKALAIPSGIRPGIYALQAVHSSFCLYSNPGDGLTQTHFVQTNCNLSPNNDMQLFYILPHPISGFTLRLAKNKSNNGTELFRCATVARGVVFGPARIDNLMCDLPNGSVDRTTFGADDQRFTLLKRGANSYNIKPNVGAAEEDDCWSMRGGSQELGADVIKWGCNGGGDQLFNLIWVAPVENTAETALLSRLNWHPGPDGHVRWSKANGVELTGPSSSSFETIADNGDYCMKRCSELKECKGWTWSAAGFGGQSKPMCHWKTTQSTPVNHGEAAYAKVISGIVRP